MMYRFFDITLSLWGLVFLSPVLILLLIVVFLDTKLPFFSQVRLGKNKKHFRIYKFRTMKPDTRDLPTHMVPESKYTRTGRFLRKFKLDELPQLWNVFIGEMSIVGPRPGLPSQTDLTKAREYYKIFDVKPGITGLSQLCGIDMSNPVLLAKTDAIMISNFSIFYYCDFILATLKVKKCGLLILN